jgi:hypothetical protein
MTTETAHEHMFPLEKPGVFGKTGPCECGLTREQALAASRGRDLPAEETGAEFTGWMEAQGYSTHPDDCEGMAEAFAAGQLAGRDLAAAAPLERERNILRGQLEHAELTITDYRNALTAQRAEFDRDRALFNEARIGEIEVSEVFAERDSLRSQSTEAERELARTRAEIARLNAAMRGYRKLFAGPDDDGNAAEIARLRAQAEASDRVVRDVLESLCQRDGLPLESTVTPGAPARNYELADRLGIGPVFGLQPQSAEGQSS